MAQVNGRIDRLVTLFTGGRIEEADYDRQYAALLEQRKALMRAEEEDATPTAQETALGILAEMEGNGAVTREKLRQLVLIMVK